ERRNQSAWRAEALPEEVAAELRATVGAEHMLETVADRFAYARDRLPWALFRLRAGELPASLPAAIVLPGSQEDLVRIVEVANRRRALRRGLYAADRRGGDSCGARGSRPGRRRGLLR